MRKKLTVLFLCAAMVFSLCACGDSKGETTEGTEGTESTSVLTPITVADDIERPTVTSLPEHDDYAAILTGDYEVTEDAVLDYLEGLMADAGLTYTEVKDRTVQDGDVVGVDYTGYLNGEAFDGGSATGQYIDVTNNCGVDISSGSVSGYFIDGFSSGLVGAKIGETIRYEVTFPDDYGNEELAGQLTEFEFKINGIYEKSSAEDLTDAFVEENMSSYYEVSTVDELMALCEENVAYGNLMNYLIDNAEVKIPEEYVDARYNLYYDFLCSYYGGESAFEESVTYNGYTLDDAKAECLDVIKNVIREESIFAAIVEEDDLQLDEEWYEDYISKYTSAYLSYYGEYYDIDEATVEQNFLQQYGYGDTEAGKAYFMNVRTTREAIIEKYNKTK